MRMHETSPSVGSLMAPPVHKQSEILNSNILNMVKHAAYRVLQFNIFRSSTESGWNSVRIDARHSDVLFRCPEFKSNGDTERDEHRFGYAVADVCSAIVGLNLINNLF
jgi:hypothetical protein